MNSPLSVIEAKVEFHRCQTGNSNENLNARLIACGQRLNRLSYYSTKKILILICILFTPFIIGGCSSLQNNTANTLEKQIELQQMEHELTMEPASTEKKSAADFEAQGDRYLQQGDINRAYFYYVKGLGVEPDNVSLLHKQGMLLLKKNNFIEAERVYEKMLSLAAKDPRALAGHSISFFGQGKFDEAEKGFLAVIEFKTNDWQSYEYLGLIYSQRQEFDRAIAQFKKALSYKPNSLSATNNLAVTYYMNGEFDNAVRLYRDLAATTSDRKVHNNLALAYFQLGKYQNALESFKKGTNNEATAYNTMGREYLFARKYDEAIEAFEKAIVLNPKYYTSAQKNLDLAKREQSSVLGKSVQ